MTDLSGTQFDRQERMQKLVKQVRGIQAAQNEAQLTPSPAPKRVKGRRSTYEPLVKEKPAKAPKKTKGRRSTWIPSK